MGYTVKEFSKVITGEFTGDQSELNGHSLGPQKWQIDLQNSTMIVDIQIQQKPQRELGAMVIPVLQVDFEVNGATEQQSNFFFKKFFKYFHKGGG